MSPSLSLQTTTTRTGPGFRPAGATLLLLACLSGPAVSAVPVMQLPSGSEATPGLALPNSVASEGKPEASFETIQTTSARSVRLSISSPFGWRSDPIRGARRKHAGIDLPGRPGQSIHATGSGWVVRAGWAGGYGKLVEIEHPGGVRTRYGHLSRILVRRGEQVSQGEVIGAMGSTGRSTGTHLHYEVRVNGMAADPMGFMGQTRSRQQYETRWAAESVTVPRWTGWQDQATRSSLPQAVIR